MNDKQMIEKQSKLIITLQKENEIVKKIIDAQTEVINSQREYAEALMKMMNEDEEEEHE